MKTAEELIQLALPSVLEGLKKELTQTIDWQIKQDATKVVSDHITNWIKENVLPEVSKQLVESKEGLIALGATIGPGVVEAVSAAYLESLKKKLENSWERTKIFESLFK